jgi:hypothetical protein
MTSIRLSLILLLLSVAAAEANTVWWIIGPGAVVCVPLSCLNDVNGAAGGQYTAEVDASCTACFLNSSGVAHRGIELQVEEYPFAFGQVYANCATYNPSLYTSVSERLAAYDYLDDFGELNIADGLEGNGIVLGTPWWSPIDAPFLLYQMKTESDCYEDNTRLIIPAPRNC